MATYPGGSGGGSGGLVNVGGTTSWTGYNGSSLVTEQRPNLVPASALYTRLDEMYAAGQVEQVSQLIDLVKAAGFTSWKAAVDAAALDPEKGSRPIEDYLKWHASLPGVQALMAKKSNAGSGYGPFSQTDTSIDLSSESQAAAIADQVWQQELGRRASESEIKAFQKALDAAQRQDPSVTQQSGTRAPHSSTTTTTRTGGFDPTRFATDFAQSRPDYAETYAATSFMSLLDRAISNPNAVDQAIAGKL